MDASPEQPGGAFAHGSLRFLPSPIRQPRSAIVSIGVGWATAFFPSIALSAAAAALFPTLGRPDFQAGGPLLLFLLVIFSPAVETLIMALVLEVLRRFMPPTAAVVVSAVGWGIAHSTAAPAWGLIIWWPFLILSTLYLTWRETGKVRAFAVAATTHACQNLPVALLLMQR